MSGGEGGGPRTPAPETPAAAEQPPRSGRLAWVRAASDRVPTTWFAGIATALFLAATAAFGGLSDVPVAALPELEAGARHDSEQVALTVERAVLIDEFPEAGITVEPGQRVLALLVTAENRWTKPLATTGSSGAVSQTLRLPSISGEGPVSVARFDDATTDPRLQPGVPAQLVATWAVEADALSEGDRLRVEVRDAQLYTGSFVTDGQTWSDAAPAALVTVRIEDVGAGADAEDGGDG
ncbi:hypothetical protein ACTU3I_03890 [Microbacterium sp. RD1]|uniref:hypothetical protein n=1 Tax=Microbacterium sp. RD1 TaxID=3457313 RepID=UPI003FA58A12